MDSMTKIMTVDVVDCIRTELVKQNNPEQFLNIDAPQSFKKGNRTLNATSVAVSADQRDSLFILK